MKKLLSTLLTILLIAFTFTGCTSWGTDDATTYVRALLDSTYLDKHDEATKITNMTLEESESFYQDGLQIEANYLANYFWFENVTEELNERVLSLLDQIYSHSKYTIHDAEELSDDRFLVKVEVHPIDIMLTTNNGIEAFQDEFNSTYDNVDTESMSASEYDEWYLEYDLNWSMSVLDILEFNLNNIEYLDPIIYNIEVFLDAEGYYDVSDDYYNIDEVIIQY